MGEEEGLKKSQAEVQEALESRLQQGFDTKGEDWINVYEHQLHGEEDFKENLFWQEEIESRLKEHAAEILTLRLLQQEKRAIEAASASSDAAVQDAEWAAEIAQVEREFEEATRMRHQEVDEKLAAKMQHAEQSMFKEVDSAACTSTKAEKQIRVNLMNRLIGRMKRNNRK